MGKVQNLALALVAALLALSVAGNARGAAVSDDGLNTATFAAGCFWCVEADFEKLPGVVEAVSGFSGGKEKNPTYKQVSSGRTGHLESVQVLYDPARITYAQLLDWYWRHVDPTDAGGSFVDRGHQYTSAIFYHDEEQKRLADESKACLEATGRFSKPIVTPIRTFEAFYPAEDYHQDFYKTHPGRYHDYRPGSGRDRFLEQVWGKMKDALPKADGVPFCENNASAGNPDKEAFVKPSDEELKKSLTPLQYKVTQKEGTEPPFKNEHWDEHREGIYVDIVSGEPLFASIHKFDSGTGWPSFYTPLEPENIVEKEDRSLFVTRVEVRSKKADSHLGHVFPDGPAPTGQRYCINSAALIFIPKEKLEQEGYGRYLDLFK